MPVCVKCQAEKSEKAFHPGVGICKSCLSRMQDDVDFVESHGVTKEEAFVNLVQAIREQAIVDDRLEDFEEYWVRDPRMQMIWSLLRESERQKSGESFAQNPD